MGVTPFNQITPQLATKEISDVYIKKNFDKLIEYFGNQNQLLNFRFFDLTFKSAVSNYKVAHGFAYKPEDIITTKVTGTGTVVYNYGLFDKTNLNITVTGPCRVRFFVGTYWNYKTTVNDEDSTSFTAQSALPSASTTSSTDNGNVTNPMTTLGDMIIGGVDGVPARLAGGSAGQILSFDGSTAEWVSPSAALSSALSSTSSSPLNAANLGLAATVSGGSMIITLTQGDGTAPSAAGPVLLSFKPTTGLGTYSTVQATSTKTFTIPNGANLGMWSNTNIYVWVYAINNAGSIELGVSCGFTPFDDLSIQSTTAISAASASITTLYSTTSLTNKAIRLIGRIKSQHVGGSWNTTPTEIGLMPVPRLIRTPPVAYTPTFTNMGSVTGVNIRSYRDGRHLVIEGYFTCGVTLGAANSMTIGFNGVNGGGGINIDTTLMGATPQPIGLVSMTTAASYSAFMLYSGSATTIGYSVHFTAGAIQGVIANANDAGSSNTMAISARVPITGWSEYGP